MTISIGRNTDNQIVINDINKTVSGFHAVIQVKETIIYLTDKSMNGTKVNGYRIPKSVEYPINRGDNIMFADKFPLDWSKIPDFRQEVNKPIIHKTNSSKPILWLFVFGIVVASFLTNPTSENAKQFLHSNSKKATLLTFLNNSKWGSFFLTSSVCRKNYFIFSVFYLKFDVLLQRKVSVPYAFGCFSKIFVLDFDENDVENKLKEKSEQNDTEIEQKIYFDDCEEL